MRSQKAIVSFTKVRDSELVNTAQNIVNKMTINPYFTDPKPPLDNNSGIYSRLLYGLGKSKRRQ